MNRLVNKATCWFGRHVLLPIYCRIEARGLENVPLTGPLIIASNHLSDADPGVICTRISRPVAFMAKAELFKVPLLAQFLRAFGAFPVRRSQADLASLRQANDCLKQGLAVCIFPEGTRGGEEAQLKEGWPGAALIALRHNVPVLPIAITGSGGMNLPHLFLTLPKRRTVTLTVGQPFLLPPAQRLNAEAARKGTRLIMEKIASLLPPENRGYYGYVEAGPSLPSAKGDQA